ncbi:MAG: helicase, partial [Actinomycetota bacterium]|nr:helicase [Actinomycetota bacterium]
WAAARRTTLNAHYTSHEVCIQVWRAVTDLGFDGGRVLEPGCGSGNFLATRPEGITVEGVGVEVDPTTAAIAALVHPDMTVRQESFAATPLGDASFDMAVGNVPFGDYHLTDRRHNRAGLNVHNHFIVKALHLTRPGGLVAVLTSRYTLDAGSTAARDEIGKVGDLAGVVRLPDGAMRQAAGTDVSMDLLIFSRRADGAEPGGIAWRDRVAVELADGQVVEVNEAIAADPARVAGTLTVGRSAYSDHDLIVAGRDQLGDTLGPAVDHAIADARSAGLTWQARPARHRETAGTDPGAVLDGVVLSAWHVEGSIVATGGGVFGRVVSGRVVAHNAGGRQAADELGRLVALRDTAMTLLDSQATATVAGGWEQLAGRLNSDYDAYVARYGPINRFTLVERTTKAGERSQARKLPALGGFRKDPGRNIVLALEDFDEESQTATKADLFHTRLLAPIAPVEAASSAEDALAVCLDRHGHLDLTVIAGLLDTTETDARDQIGTLAFDDPASGELVIAARYLSGDVRTKLDQASAAAQRDGSGRWATNVVALAEVMPADLGPGQITARLGETWIPAPVVAQFAAETLGAVDVGYEAKAGAWAVTARYGRWTAAMTSEWGTQKADASRLLADCLNQRATTVSVNVGGGKSVVDQDATLAAREKQEALHDRFAVWVWEDPDRAGALAVEYNRRFNSVVLPSYDGSHLSLPGKAEQFEPHAHQRDAVWRMISEPTVLLAHGVGAGKTATLAMGMHELRRLGLVRKPAVIVPNHMLDQFSREWQQLYPQARLLIAGTKDLEGAKRREFVARCATGDWDAVVMTHNAFKSIPVSAETQADYLRREVEDLSAVIGAGRSMTVKRLEKVRAKTEARLEKLLGSPKDTGGVAWEMTGIDYLGIDEAHLFKNKATATNIEGAGIRGSERAEDLAMKLDWLRDQGGTHVASLATATPIANSLSEMFVMQSYLQPAMMERAGVASFDGWAANFARTTTAVELSPDGSSWRMKTRFARFVNVPELVTMFRQTADVKLSAELGLKLPAVTGGKATTVVVAGSDELARYVEGLAERAENIKNRTVRPEEDNMLMVTNDGRNAALDLRLVGLPAPPGGKLTVCARQVAAAWREGAERTFGPGTAASGRPGTLQLVFCDLGTPNDNGRWSVYDELRDEMAANGIPAERIRFIHEAKTDADKAALFAACRGGSVAVLIGSTEKMGVGTNVQLRAATLHHLDAPWRPADIEQREGRIIRQGNLNAEVGISRFVTEGSFDTYMWQTLERKAGFIAQVMTGQATGRDIEDVGEQALSFAEVKALASGDPLVLERAGVQAEVTRLSRAENAHRADQSNLARLVRSHGESAEINERHAEQFTAAAARVQPVNGERFTATIGEHTYGTRADAGAALRTRLLQVMEHTRHDNTET